MNLRVEEGVSHGRAVVVLRLEVGGRVHHSACAVPAASHLHGEVFLWNQLCIEPSRREHVLLRIDH